VAWLENARGEWTDRRMPFEWLFDKLKLKIINHHTQGQMKDENGRNKKT
jgi:hypothetical protein